MYCSHLFGCFVNVSVYSCRGLIVLVGHKASLTVQQVSQVFASNMNVLTCLVYYYVYALPSL